MDPRPRPATAARRHLSSGILRLRAEPRLGGLETKTRRSLVAGDNLNWEDRPVSTSLDPGFTRLPAYGWADDQEWTPEQRDIHFQITATRGYYLGSATNMPFNEHELILAPGQRYQVTDIRQHSTGSMLGRNYSGSRHRLYIVLEELHD